MNEQRTLDALGTETDADANDDQNPTSDDPVRDEISGESGAHSDSGDLSDRLDPDDLLDAVRYTADGTDRRGLDDESGLFTSTAPGGPWKCPSCGSDSAACYRCSECHTDLAGEEANEVGRSTSV